MNRAIVRLFGVMMLLFAVLVFFTSRWTVFDASGLQNNALNKLATYASWKVKRGEILADDGTTVLARSVRGSGGIWNRTYPQGSLFSQAVGFSNLQEGASAGMEQFFTPELSGPKSALAKVFGSFNGGTPVGDDVYSTLDPSAQKLAKQLLAGRTGSVVAIVPATGAVKVMYSNPSYDDNNPQRYANSKPSDCGPNPFDNGCLVNLATNGLFPPGSTFKVVTTAAALNSGKYTPQTTIDGHSPLIVSGTPLANDAGEEYGEISLTDALTNSVNTVFAQVGQKLGAAVMEKYMKLFGFYSLPPLDYPGDEMTESGEAFAGRETYVFRPPTYGAVDLGRMSIGQDKMLVTPLQMAMVVATVANHGTLMEPRLATKVVNSDGQTVQSYPPTVYHQVMKPAVAGELTQMMTDVVDEGTGRSAILLGIKVAGKTGTASVGENASDGAPLDDAWFIGFAPVQDPKIAVAVTLEKIPNGYGGQYAAPIAAQIIKKLLAENQ